jgi:hypothetical protein
MEGLETPVEFLSVALAATEQLELEQILFRQLPLVEVAQAARDSLLLLLMSMAMQVEITMWLQAGRLELLAAMEVTVTHWERDSLLLDREGVAAGSRQPLGAATGAMEDSMAGAAAAGVPR